MLLSSVGMISIVMQLYVEIMHGVRKWSLIFRHELLFNLNFPHVSYLPLNYWGFSIVSCENCLVLCSKVTPVTVINLAGH